MKFNNIFSFFVKKVKKYWTGLKKYAKTCPISSEMTNIIIKKGNIKMSNIAERVKKIVVEHLGVDEAKVQDNASFIDDLGADSLDTVELVMAFEEEFGCSIPDDAAEKIRTVKDAIDFIEKQA